MDSFGILVTVISMVTNLGIGALLVNSGLFYLFDIPQSTGVLLALIVVMMVVATLAAVTGVEKGIAMLSNINVGFLCLLLLFVFLAGPTLNLLNGMLQNLGDYLTSLVSRSFDMYLYGKARQWQGAWTLFYWAWWVAWAPFVGLFIARISKGRSIRELIFGVLLIRWASRWPGCPSSAIPPSAWCWKAGRRSWGRWRKAIRRWRCSSCSNTCPIPS